jgi:glycosyltransferase involved in cell wall biosynthesis
VNSILFEATFFILFDYKKYSHWNDGITRYTFEVASELSLQRPKECCYASSNRDQIPKESIELFRRDKRFPSWNLETEQSIFKENSSWFFPNVHYLFPEELKKHKQINFFVMIHDLIPLLSPEHFSSGFNVGFRKALKSYCKEKKMHFFANSEHTKIDFCRITGVTLDKVTVTYLAADTKVFFPCRKEDKLEEVKKKYNISNQPYFFCFSRFIERKNPFLLIKAFLSFLQTHKNSGVKLVFAGINLKSSSNSYLNQALEFCLQNGLQGHIHWVEFVEEKDLPILYSGSLACFFPSFYEGFGLTILEAMQCGSPVVTSNTSSIPEVVGDAGILLPPDNVSLWIEAMKKIYENKDLRERLSEKSLKRALLFSWKKTVYRMIEAFESKKKTYINI